MNVNAYFLLGAQSPLPLNAEPEEPPRKPKKGKRSQPPPSSHSLPVRTKKRRIPTRAAEEVNQEVKREPLSDNDFRIVSEIFCNAAAKGKREAEAKKGKSDVEG